MAKPGGKERREKRVQIISECWCKRAAAGAEIDLILQFPGGEVWAIEVKSGLAPKLKKGFYNALEDIKPDRSFVVYAGSARYPFSEETEVISLFELSRELATLPKKGVRLK